MRYPASEKLEIIRLVEGEGDDPLAHVVGNAVPDPVRCRSVILQRIEAA